MERIVNLSLSENVFNNIRKDILNNKLKPGDKLIETELANQLGVSRTPVREALHKLEREGLVEILPRKYCLVKGITSNCIKEINLIRAQLEPSAAKFATKKLTEEDINYLGMLLNRSESYYKLCDITSLMRVHEEFHQTIIKASNLPRIIKILENMREYIISFRSSFMARPQLVERSIREHREIYEALKSRDEESVENLVNLHLKGISEYEDVVLEDISKFNE